MDGEKVQGEEGVRAIVRDTIEEFLRGEHARTAPAYKNELVEEKKKREQLERRLNELVAENQRSRKMAEEADRSATIRSELHRLGVAKVEIAFKAVKDDIFRAEDGRLLAKGDDGEVSVKEYLSHFLSENPEFLPARIQGGSGVTTAHKAPPPPAAVVSDLDRIRPGMSPEEAERIRQEIVRITSQSLRAV
jgi:hypothetical protein